MTKRKNTTLPILGVLGIGLACGYVLWKQTAQVERRRDHTGYRRSRPASALRPSPRWELGETELFSSLHFLPH